MQETKLKLNLLLFSYDYRKCMFVDLLTGYIGPPNFFSLTIVE
jgi:hypothetical protein